MQPALFYAVREPSPMLRTLCRAVLVLVVSAMPVAQAASQGLLGPAKPPPRHISVATSVSPAVAAPGKPVSLIVDVTPKPGIHVYAPGAKDYLPIGLKLAPTAGVVVRAAKFPKPATLYFEALNERVPVYDKPFRITDEIVIGRPAGGRTLTIAGTIEYQACDDTTCFPPATVPVSWALTLGR
jgi:DsbC/DsbD-like thiol-disulfide interchange protein